ncbi:MAG: hypothetical protein KC618_06830 [Candidatus Omnitrophica bacterium]|nr:hypothetical protein [Candidatus Omnitrophota bacterium]
MKKFSLILIFSFICATRSWAAPAYGTKMPAQNQFFLGGQTYVVLERNLEGVNGEMESLQHLFLISYGVLDWLSLDLKGGAGDIHQTLSQGNEINYPAFVGGGYGFRIKFYDNDKTKAVFGFQHISIHPYSVKINGTKNKAVLDDWQLSFLASRDFDVVTPYIGGKWSRMDYIHWVEDDRNRVKSDTDQSIGVVVGMDVPVSEKVWLNLEGQFVDVQAFSGSVNFHF